MAPGGMDPSLLRTGQDDGTPQFSSEILLSLNLSMTGLGCGVFSDWGSRMKRKWLVVVLIAYLVTVPLGVLVIRGDLTLRGLTEGATRLARIEIVIPTSTPPPPPTPASQLQVNANDFAALFARIDNYQRSTDEYKGMLVKLSECLAEKMGTTGFDGDTELPDGERAAAQWMTLIISLMVVPDSNGRVNTGYDLGSLGSSIRSAWVLCEEAEKSR